jgi:hypothetical protein
VTNTHSAFLKTLLIIAFIFLLFPVLHAQQKFIKNYSAGFRIFEYNMIGNNPTTLAPQLKDPVPYLYALNNFSYNSLYGNPAIAYMKNFYLNLEMRGRDSASRFWKNHSIQAGIVFTNKLSRNAGAIEDIQWDFIPDTIKRTRGYSYTEQIQFLGANTGINRRFKVAKNIQLLAGLQVQGSFAIIHNYKQQLDSSAFEQRAGWIYQKSTSLPDLAGKQYFQWQAYIPLGMEVNVYKQEFFIRLEAMIGLIGSSTREKTISNREAHGVGIWLVYQPVRK